MKYQKPRRRTVGTRLELEIAKVIDRWHEAHPSLKVGDVVIALEQVRIKLMAAALAPRP